MFVIPGKSHFHFYREKFECFIITKKPEKWLFTREILYLQGFRRNKNTFFKLEKSIFIALG